MENAKAIWAAHRDEQHAHLHIVASKIDPDTGRAYNLKSDYLKLSKWAQQYEREHGGIVCLRREGANELRDAIDNRDPHGRAGGADPAAGNVHGRRSRTCARKADQRRA